MEKRDEKEERRNGLKYISGILLTSFALIVVYGAYKCMDDNP